MFSRIYEGRVFHQRIRPRKHRLTYRVFSFLIDIDELPELDEKYRFFSHNKFNVFSFHDKDHGTNKGAGTNDSQPLRPYIIDILTRAGIETNNGPIRLLCYPRIFGYVFNPLCVYYCYDTCENLQALIYEVSNTFGERHSYVIAVSQGTAQGNKTTKGNKTTRGNSTIIRQTCKKDFYVSPFMEMACTYNFLMRPPSATISVVINQTDATGPVLKACFTGNESEISNRNLSRILIQYPLMTLKIIIGIHWEALQLWRKGLKFVTRPQAPKNPVTYVKMESKP